MRSRLLALILAFCVGCASLAWAAPAKKKKKGKKSDEEPITQVLELPKDPPAFTIADASRLIFFSSPLSAKGLMSPQVRDATKALLSQSHGAQIVKIRAIVAGSGDLRRVPAVISEVLTDKKLTLPAISVVQVGALPMVGAQVQLEAIAVDGGKRPVNPNGLAFVSGQAGPAKDAGARLVSALAAVNLKPESVRRITCFLDSLDTESSVRQQMGIAFPRANAIYAQLRRDTAGDFSECEAISALDKAPEKNPAMMGIGERYSQAAFVGPVRIAFTGVQMAFGREEKDVRLAVERFSKLLESAGTGWKSIAMSHSYLLTGTVRDKLREVRGALINGKEPPASTLLIFEGLPSLDASFGIEAISVVER